MQDTFRQSSPAFNASVGCGARHEIAITCTLPEWKHDVWDIRAAWELRDALAQELDEETADWE